MTRTISIAAFFALMGGTAFAEINVDSLVADYQAQGFTRIEIRNGLTQTKVEAIRGTEKVEIILDRASGEVLKTETETVGAFEDKTPGVSIRERKRDFVRTASAEDDNSDDDNEDHVSGSDDGADHDAGDDHGGDADHESDGGDDHESSGHDSSDHDSSDHDSGGHDGEGSDHDGGDSGKDGGED
jgi:hypothetical protein